MSVVYSALKPFAFPLHLAPSADGTLRAPVHVRIKPINACNESCWYCAYRLDDLSLGSEMKVRDMIPEAKMAEIADDLVAMGVRAVTFSGGGEPLIYPHLARTIRRLGWSGIKIGTLTNGLSLRGDVADALAEHATWVRVSIDAWDGESYARSRRVGTAAFDRVVENVRAFALAAPACSVGISFITNRDNAEHVFEFCSLAKRIGAEHVKISACIVANGAAENDAYHEPIRDGVRREIERVRRELEDDRFKVLDHYHALGELFERPYSSCPMLEYLTVIGADCTVYTCQDKAYTTAGTLGSIRSQSFRTMWTSPENAARVRGLDPRTACRHHCVAHAKNLLLSEYRALAPDHLAFV